MTLNLTLFCLSFGGCFLSPVVTSSPRSFKNSYNFKNLDINKIFNSFFYKSYSKANFLSTNNFIFKDSTFSHTLNSAIKVTTADKNFTSIINTNQFYLAHETYIDTFTIDDCCFTGCATTSQYENGGSLCIAMTNTNLIISNTLFVRCTSALNGGAIYSLGHSITLTNTVFSNCHAYNTGGCIDYNRTVSGTWHETTISETLFTKCSSKQLPINFYINRNMIQNSNITFNSNSEQNDQNSQNQFCVGFPLIIESTSDAMFIFMNLIGNDGDFLVDFQTSPWGTKANNVNIIENVNLNYFFQYDPTVLPTQDHSFENFAFFRNRPKSGLVKLANIYQSPKFVLTNCFFDWSQTESSQILNGYTENGGSYVSVLSSFTQSKLLLMPSKCQIQSDTFSLSDVFSPSLTFSKSDHFTESASFSPSSAFTSSAVFSKSSQFTKSSVFSPSSIFSPSKEFSPSSAFSPSKVFSKSSQFTKSSIFSSSKEFTASSKFTKSSDFSPSSVFSHSKAFSNSKEFTKSSIFSPSKEFTASSQFTKSSIFSPSSKFSPSLPFTVSFLFTASSKFHQLDLNSLTTKFSFSSTFSESSQFSLSSHFTNSPKFSPSSSFSLSSEFTFSIPFVNFTQSHPFTPSKPFTPSNFFTPERTKVPDPMNIFHQAAVSGKKPVFSKESLKEAAAPASISVVIIVVSVVFSVFYLRRKLYEIRHQDNIPDFDTSLEEDDINDSESSYSYSYYTYSYVYESQSYDLSDNESDVEENQSDIDDYSDFTYDDYGDYDSDITYNSDL